MRKWLLGTSVVAAGIAVLAGLSVALPGQAQSAVETPLRINAGGSDTTDAAGNQWQRDREYSASAGWGYVDNDGVGGRANHRLSISGTDDDSIFYTERWGMDAYRVDVANGTYHIELLFAETFSGITGPGQRVFDVIVEGETVISGFDAYADVGFATAVRHEVRDVQVSDGRLEIAFVRNVEQPMIKGIVVTAAEPEAESTPEPTASPEPSPTPDPTPMPDASPTPEPTATPEALETAATGSPSSLAAVPLYVNVGGEAFQDRTGNEWAADQEYGESNGWGYVEGAAAAFREEYHGGVGYGPHSSGREGMTAYRFNLPNDAQYAVTLDFTGRLDDIGGYGERVFYVQVGETVAGEQSAELIGPIDPWTAFHSIYVPSTYQVEYIRPVDGVLEVVFIPVVGEPVINGIMIEQRD